MAYFDQVLYSDIIKVLIIAIFITAAFIIRTRTLLTLVSVYAVQSIFLALMALIIFYEGGSIDLTLLLLAIIVIISKVIGIPMYIRTIAKRLRVQRDVQFEYLGSSNAMILSIFIIIIIYVSLSNVLQALSQNISSTLLLGAVAGTSLEFMGLIIIFTRKMLITDIIGYLTMENGVLLVSFTIAAIPIIIEVLIILDLFMWTLLTAVMAFGIDTTIEDFHRRLHPFTPPPKTPSKPPIIFKEV